MIKKKAYSVTNLIRRVLEEEDTYEGAVRRLENTPLMAAAYLVISGTEKD
jgi:hypothetical protein